jgi:hypothetical protein
MRCMIHINVQISLHHTVVNGSENKENQTISRTTYMLDDLHYQKERIITLTVVTTLRWPLF